MKSKKSKPRDIAQWMWSFASALPIVIWIVDIERTSGPPDQKAGAAMNFIIWGPLSFLIALASANRARKNWCELIVADKFIGLGPLVLLVSAIAFIVLWVMLH